MASNAVDGHKTYSELKAQGYQHKYILQMLANRGPHANVATSSTALARLSTGNLEQKLTQEPKTNSAVVPASAVKALVPVAKKQGNNSDSEEEDEGEDEDEEEDSDSDEKHSKPATTAENSQTPQPRSKPGNKYYLNLNFHGDVVNR